MPLVQAVSGLIGAAVGLIALAIFTFILQRRSELQAPEATKQLHLLIYTVLGAGLSDYVIFDYMLSSGTIVYYLLGFGIVFFPFGVLVFVLSLRK